MESTLRILDVKEKEMGDVKPPSFPTPTSTVTGFPQHRIRTRTSTFKQQRQATRPQTQVDPQDAAVSEPSTSRLRRPQSSRSEASRPETRTDSDVVPERRAIGEETKAVLDSMSPDEIAAAQRDLLSGLDPEIVQMLLRRANLDENQASSSALFDPPAAAAADSTSTEQTQSTPQPSETRLDDRHPKQQPNIEEKAQETGRAEQPRTARPKKTVTFDVDTAAPPKPPADIFPASRPPPASQSHPPTADGPAPPTNTTHFPRAPDPAHDLDPSDPDFLEALHAKFFPNLPADPSKLAWMAPLPTVGSAADRESPYWPGQASLPVSQLRFDFRGALVPPRVSRLVPVTAGLHHHGEAPEAAGYTVPELARLARSSVPGQRCIAFRTLGRLLFRLGRGEWGIGQGGRAGEDEDDLAFALWRCLSENRVLDSLGEAAAVVDGAGHQSAKAYALEALWLFEKGGWKERWRGL